MEVKVERKSGKEHLFVNGFIVATEGDRCRDSDLPAAWTKKSLKDIVNNTATRKLKPKSVR